MQIKIILYKVSFVKFRRFCNHHATFFMYLYVFSMLLSTINCTPAESKRRFSPRRDRFNCAGNLPPRHFPSPRGGDNGFRIKVEGEPEFYRPLQEYTVTLQSTLPATFRGFAIRAAMDDDRPAGQFTPINSYTSRTLTSCTNVATHSNPGKKTRVKVRWRAPLSGCVFITASVIQKGIVWFKNENRLLRVICNRNTTTQRTTSNSCCACGSATYRITFYGLWSPSSHPKDYPAFSTHWSNIIGASHSSDYVIWEYGGYASEGVQKVAEWGWPGNLEDEIRAQRDSDVMSVIKTKAQWPAYQPRNLREAPSDQFDVDSSRHFVSLVTMLGPSPDWNVGLSKESMCTKTCGWKGIRKYDLVPWDAGTDSGVSYMSPNSPSVPHEKIRALTSSDHSESPFFNETGGPIPPVARIIIKRIGLSGEECGKSEFVNGTDENELTRTLEAAGVDIAACMYSEWSDWGECGVTCGWGIKIRNRMVKFHKEGAACQSTMEKEICQGSGECGNQTDATECLYSDWTSWSKCSSPCGQSLRFKSRVLQWPSEPQNCREPLKEMSDCHLPPCTCSYSPWSKWMSCPVTCGIGQTVRKRALLSQESGCSESLIQTNQCMTSTSCESDFSDTPGCTYTPWSDWSSCPVTCGIGQAFRKRVLQTATVTSCPNFYMENSKCMTSSSCAEACEYGTWTAWMSCSATCGVGTTLRKRFLSVSNTPDECEAFLMETSSCENSPCAEQLDECFFMPWTEWMPCSANCGKGETLRKRFLNQTSSSGNCKTFEMETNICMVSCDSLLSSSQCMYSDWTPWTQCHQSCERSRTRTLLQSLTGDRCNDVVTETKKCVSSFCLENLTAPECETTPWNEWTECLPSKCGKTGVRKRARESLQRLPSNECTRPALKEKEKCPAKRCVRDCVMASWSNWSSCECSSANTHHKQIRRRRIISRPKHGGRPCLARRQKRRCVCT